MTFLQMYLLTRLNHLREMFDMFRTVSAILILPAFLVGVFHSSLINAVSMWPIYVIVLLIGLSVIFSIIFMLTPTTKELIFILGVPMIISKDFTNEASKIPPKLMKFLNDYIDELVSDKPKSNVTDFEYAED